MNSKARSQSGILQRTVASATGEARTTETPHKHHRHRPNTVGVADGAEFVLSAVGFVALIVIAVAALAEIALNIRWL